MDTWSFYGQAGDRAIINTARTSGTIDLYVHLYPPDGGPAEASYWWKLDHQLKQTGLYTIVLEEYGNDETGGYNISFAKIPSDLRPGIYNTVPPNGAIVHHGFVWLIWEPVQGATGYDLYFGRDVIEPLWRIGENLPSPSMAVGKLEGGKIYYWHVVAHTPQGDIQGPYWWFQVSIYREADLAITKTDSPDPVSAGSNLTYTITVINNGPWEATGVTMTDRLSLKRVIFVSATPTRGSCTRRGGSEVICKHGNLARGSSVTVTIVVIPTRAGTITNKARVSGTEIDPNFRNNEATAVTTVISPPSSSSPQRGGRR